MIIEKLPSTKIVMLKTYKQGKMFVELGWNQDEPHYSVFVGHIAKDGDSFYQSDSYDRYYTEDEAKRAYDRQVAKVKRA